MVYANWREELQAFESECQRIREARRASLPIKILGLAPLGSLPFIGKMPLGRQILAGAGIALAGISLLLELDKQREAYGGSLKLDLTPNSDWDNLSGAFETRSPRWYALCFLYAQLDPLHLKDRLGHLPDDEGTRLLNRCIRRVQKGLEQIAILNPGSPRYGEQLRFLTVEWKSDVSKTLDHALFVAGAINADDLDPDEFEVEEGEEGDQAEAIDSSDAPQAAQSLKLFDWGDIQQHPDRYPHILILGKTGGGKTWLGERLLALLGGDALVIHPHAAPRDFAGYQVIGGGRNYPAITAAIDGLHSEMNLRYQRRDKGDEGYRPLTVLIDEFPSIAHFCGKDVIAQILALVREARKVQIRLVILSQGAEVKALGIEGQGSVRECFTFIRLKGFAEDFARKQGETVYTWVSDQRFPCMVEDSPADSSVLAALEKPASGVLDGWMDGFRRMQNQPISAPPIHPSTSIHNRGNQSDSHPQPSTPHPHLSTNPQPSTAIHTTSTLSPKGMQLLEWLKRKGGQATIREAITHRGFGDRAALDLLLQELEALEMASLDMAQQIITCISPA